MSKSLRELKFEFERTVVMRTLQQNEFDRKKTAAALQITVRALDKIFDRHHLVKRRFSKVLPIPPQGTVEKDEK